MLLLFLPLTHNLCSESKNIQFLCSESSSVLHCMSNKILISHPCNQRFNGLALTCLTHLTFYQSHSCLSYSIHANHIAVHIRKQYCLRFLVLLPPLLINPSPGLCLNSGRSPIKPSLQKFFSMLPTAMPITLVLFPLIFSLLYLQGLKPFLLCFPFLQNVSSMTVWPLSAFFFFLISIYSTSKQFLMLCPIKLCCMVNEVEDVPDDRNENLQSLIAPHLDL